MIYAPIEYTLTEYEKKKIAQFPHWYYPFKGRGSESEFYIQLGFTESAGRGDAIALIVDTERVRFHQRCLAAYLYHRSLSGRLNIFAIRDLVANEDFNKPVDNEHVRKRLC